MPVLASTSRVQMSYLKEIVFGEVPVTGVVRNIRNTGESLNYSISKTSSDEINAYRAVSSMVATSAEAAGALNIQMSFGEYDEFLAATLQNTWIKVGAAGLSSVFSSTITTGAITAGVAVTDFATLKRGQWFTLSGTGTTNDGKLFRVSKITAPTTTVITLDVSTPGIPGGPFAATVLRSSRLSNGVIQPSYALQREANDVGEFFVFRGMTVSSMSLNMASGSLTSGDFNFMGRDALRAAATFMPSAAVDSQAYPNMSGVSGTACALWVGGVPLLGTFVNSIALSYDNALRQQTALCALGSVGIGNGTIMASINMEVYFASGATFYSQLLDNSSVEVAFTAFDNAGNGYVFTIPKGNVSSYSVNAGSKDSELMAQITVTALLDLGNADATLRKVFFIDRMGDAMI